MLKTGTLSACALTLATFLLLSLFTSLTCSPAFLLNDCFYMAKFTFWNGFVLIGVILATWSASLSNLIGASRLISAIAEDNIFGFFLHFITRGTYKGNPIVAVFITSIFVQLCFFIGGLNSIAQISSCLFLLSYAAVNLACMCLDLSSAPNFRSDRPPVVQLIETLCQAELPLLPLGDLPSRPSWHSCHALLDQPHLRRHLRRRQRDHHRSSALHLSSQEGELGSHKPGADLPPGGQHPP